jgi:hypothetical protein
MEERITKIDLPVCDRKDDGQRKKEIQKREKVKNLKPAVEHGHYICEEMSSIHVKPFNQQ